MKYNQWINKYHACTYILFRFIYTFQTKAACCRNIEIVLHPKTELYLMCCGEMLLLLIIYIYIQCNQPCHKPRCKVCSHIDIRCSIKFDNNATISAVKADCDSQNVVYILFCAKCPNADYVGETSNRFRFDLAITNSIKRNFSGYPVSMHFNEQSHTIKDLRCITIVNHVPNMDTRKLIEQKTIIKLNTYCWT